jgi:hypothetical protein
VKTGAASSLWTIEVAILSYFSQLFPSWVLLLLLTCSKLFFVIRLLLILTY